MPGTLTPTCSVCGLRFASRPLLELHVREDHGQDGRAGARRDKLTHAAACPPAPAIRPHAVSGGKAVLRREGGNHHDNRAAATQACRMGEDRPARDDPRLPAR